MKLRRQFLWARSGATERRKTCVIQARRRAEPVGAWAGEGFTATKKIGNAAVRNRSKRRLREAARTLLPVLGKPGVDYVFIARQSTADAPWDQLIADVESALKSLAAQLE
ncbi:MAG: ribonuclease P protein component [Pseudomonadota bacterium]